MDEPREIKIITPAMSVESTWLEDVFSAKIPVLVFRGFLSPRMGRAVISDLECCAGSIRVSSYLNATLTTLGPYLARHASSPGEYFRQVRDVQPELPKSLVNLENCIYQLVAQLLQFDSLRTAMEPGSGEYSGSVVRFHANGIANPLHSDNISRDSRGAGWVVTNVAKQFSCVVCLQECTSGGILRLFERKWAVEDEQFKAKCELGYSDAVVSGCGFCEFSPECGDVYIFNPNYYHEIDRVFGVTRITLGFFFGLVDEHIKHAIAWS